MCMSIDAPRRLFVRAYVQFTVCSYVRMCSLLFVRTCVCAVYC